MITVTLMNPEVVVNLYRNHGQFACVCYNTPEKHAERVGSNCQASGHMSGSRCEYIKFRISGVDSCMALTPVVFCAVRAVMSLMA